MPNTVIMAEAMIGFKLRVHASIRLRISQSLHTVLFSSRRGSSSGAEPAGRDRRSLFDKDEGIYHHRLRG